MSMIIYQEKISYFLLLRVGIEGYGQHIAKG